MPATRHLPDSPDPEQLRRQAKELLRAARAADPTALSRFRALPSLQHASDDDLARATLALHDAQSVIAREHGFLSWNALLEHVEERTLGSDAAAREFVEAATDGRTLRAERLLALHPRIAGSSFYAALLVGDVATVESHLAKRPELATARGGPRDWLPLHYVCHTALAHSSAANADGIVAIARRLGKTPAQALLAWAIQRGTALLTTSVTPSRIRENLDISALPEDALQEIRDGVATKVRFNQVVETGVPGFIPRDR